MREAIVIAQFERRLVELGCPTRPLTEKVRELSDHYEDLKQAALEEGLSEKEAENRAAIQLGDPLILAENSVAWIRQSSWWGRHPVSGFCILPLLSFFPAWTACASLFAAFCWLLGKVFGPAYAFDENLAGALSDDRTVFESFATPLNVGLCVATMLSIALVYSRLAQRAALGLKWVVIACVACAVDSLFTHSGIYPHSLYFLVRWEPAHWFYTAIPLVFAALIWVSQSRKEKRLAWVPTFKRTTAFQSVKFPPPMPWYRMPTNWVMTALVLVISGFIICEIQSASVNKAWKARLRAKVWPGERAATMAALQADEAGPIASNEKTIDLKPFQNLTLADPVSNMASDNLSELPQGVHPFGGVAFDVEGRVQLESIFLPKAGKNFPVEVNIPIACKCARVHLLHGVANLAKLGDSVAQVILHYSDGSKTPFAIVGGAQVLGWWGPIYNTQAGLRRYTTSRDTELAWAGSNPAIKRGAPDFSLRLYRTTFTNPHPELEVSSIEYRLSSTSVEKNRPASFLVGLTVDQLP